MSFSNNIVYHAKPLGNGDLSNDIKKGLKDYQKIKKQKEKLQFSNNLENIKESQNKLNNDLKKSRFDHNINELDKNHKLPNKITDFDENDDLVKLLLKNPDDMTNEEKHFIKSLSEKEFKKFMNFLKLKSKEVNWRGNDLGSGHYKEKFISTKREDIKSSKTDNLKNLLKTIYKNDNTNKQIFSSSEEVISPNETNINNNQILNESINSVSTNFEDTAKEIFKEIDIFKETLSNHKSKLNIKKLESQKDVILKDLNNKVLMVKKDYEKVKNEISKSEIDELIDQYKSKLYDNNFDKESSVIEKINDYCRRMNLTSKELLKLLDKNSGLKNKVDVDIMELQLIKLQILNQIEAKFLIDTLKSFHDNPINLEILESFFEQTPQTIDTEILQEDNYEEDCDYDYNSFKDDDNIVKEDKRKKLLKKRGLSDIEEIFKAKCVIRLQSRVRTFLKRKNYLKWKENRLFNLSIIISNMRNYIKKLKLLRNEAAKKIQYHFRKKCRDKKKEFQMSLLSSRWIKKKDFNRNTAAIIIQRYWRLYRQNMMFKFYNKDSSKMDINLLKTKICFLCCNHRVTHVCKNCDDNHYCESCFNKYHLRGIKRNHKYIRINDLINVNKKERLTYSNDVYNDVSKLKSYIIENHVELYEQMRIWDFNNTKKIKYGHLKDALSFKFFKIEPQFRDMILNLALKYLTSEKLETKIDDAYIDYENFYLKLIE